MYTRYFRKKNSTDGTADVEWIEMSGEEFYDFVTAPENRNRYFVDMGDVVLECSKEEYKKFKVEDDHSRYILKQEDGWSTISLSILAQQEFESGAGTIADTNPSVEETAIQGVLMQELHEILCQLPLQDYRLIYALYLAKPRKTIRQLSAEYGIPVMTLQDRKQKIVSSLQTRFSDRNIFDKTKKYFRTNSKKVRNR